MSVEIPLRDTDEVCKVCVVFRNQELDSKLAVSICTKCCYILIFGGFGCCRAQSAILFLALGLGHILWMNTRDLFLLQGKRF